MPNSNPEGVKLARTIHRRIFGPHNDNMGLPPSYRTAKEQHRIRLILNMTVPEWLFAATTGSWEWVGVTIAELALAKTHGDFVVVCYKHLRSLAPTVPVELAESVSDENSAITDGLFSEALEALSRSVGESDQSLGDFAEGLLKQGV
jgi:hypothetical protein